LRHRARGRKPASVERARPQDEAGSAGSRHKRWALFCLGWVFFGLGVIGTLLPVVPTTPFMLLALWAFSRSSDRFHHWLRNHRVFGPPLQRWDRDRVIPLWVKVVAIGSMAVSTSWIAFGTRAPWYSTAAMGAVMVVGAAYILRFPSRSPARARDAREDAAPR
jgi:hypothetical protein